MHWQQSIVTSALVILLLLFQHIVHDIVCYFCMYLVYYVSKGARHSKWIIITNWCIHRQRQPKTYLWFCKSIRLADTCCSLITSFCTYAFEPKHFVFSFYFWTRFENSTNHNFSFSLLIHLQTKRDARVSFRHFKIKIIYNSGGFGGEELAAGCGAMLAVIQIYAFCFSRRINYFIFQDWPRTFYHRFCVRLLCVRAQTT